MTSVRVDFDVEMRTRDGVVLRSDVYRPDTAEPVPAIVLRTPYGKGLRAMNRYDGLQGVGAAQRGYAFVAQDVRGRFASEGEYSPVGSREGEDGYDCIEWVATQPWCSGRVGMVGGSYESLVQWMAAEHQPPSLSAICPQFTGDAKRGALMLDSILIAWAAGQAMDWVTKKAAEGAATEGDLAVVMEALARPQEFARWLPPADMPLMKVGSLFSYEEMLRILRGAAGIRCDLIQVPALVVGGWYDIDPTGCDEVFRRLLAEGGPRARQHSAYVLGPWEHCVVLEAVGELSFGPFAGLGFGLADVQTRFFDQHLRDAEARTPRATWLVGGANTWRSADEWPPPGTSMRTWYLSSEKGANSRDGDGVLSDAAPKAGGEDVYRYDPHDPCPSFGGRFFRIGGSLPGPFDQRRVEIRDDVLVYTTAPLADAIEVAGDARVVLHLSTDVRDTDFAVKLCDVDPDGISINVADNFLRMRFREGMDSPVWLEPGAAFELNVELTPVGWLFKAGHRIRVQVTSSCFPHYDRNMNTDLPEGTDPVGVTATHRLRFGPDTVSRLELAVL